MATKAKMNKFKVGDKVRILPSAIDIGVFKSELGGIGVVIDCYYMDIYIRVYMDNVCKETGCRKEWAVRSDQIELFIKVGQQLLFAFMRAV